MTAETPDSLGLVWYVVDLEQIEPYETWKPASLKWAKKVNWAKINDLVRNNLTEYPANDPDQALASARGAGLSRRDTDGLYSLYVEPVFATSRQITSGGHRLTAMKAQGLRWGLGNLPRRRHRRQRRRTPRLPDLTPGRVRPVPV